MKELELKEGEKYYKVTVYASDGTTEEIVFSGVGDRKFQAKLMGFLFEILFNVCNFYVHNLSTRREVIEFIQ